MHLLVTKGSRNLLTSVFDNLWQFKYVACRYCLKYRQAKLNLNNSKKLKMRVSFSDISEKTVRKEYLF